jgi:hypothetical protein
MNSQTIKKGFLGILLGFSLVSCSVETETTELVIESQTFTFEDIYEGSNSATIELDMAALTGANENITGKDIERAFISSVKLTKNDSVGFADISSTKLQLMGEGENTPMVTVGINNEVDGLSKDVSLEIIQDVDLTEYIKGGKVYLILDGNFKADNEEYQDVKATITFGVDTELKK